MNVKLATILILILGTPSAQAQSQVSCSTIDLRDPGYSMENVKISQQGELGTCYAHAAVKAFESKLKSGHQIDKNFKASIFAAFVRNTDKDKYLDNKYRFLPEKDHRHVAFGNFCSIIDQLKEQGVCDAKSLESGKSNWKLNSILFGLGGFIQRKMKLKSSSAELFYHLQDKYEIERSNLKTSQEEVDKLSETLKNGQILVKSLSDQRNTILADRRQSGAQNFSTQDFYNIEYQIHELRERLKYVAKEHEDAERRLISQTAGACPMENPFHELHKLNTHVNQAIFHESPLSYLRAVVDLNCKTTIKAPDQIAKSKCQTLVANKGSETPTFSQFMNEEFKKEKTASPIGILYHAGFLVGKQRTAVGNVLHASLIIGRKIIKGSCHYLIRNSVGKDCSQYHHSEVPIHCDKGDTWIKDSDLFERTEELSNPFAPG